MEMSVYKTFILIEHGLGSDGICKDYFLCISDDSYTSCLRDFWCRLHSEVKWFSWSRFRLLSCQCIPCSTSDYGELLLCSRDFILLFLSVVRHVSTVASRFPQSKEISLNAEDHVFLTSSDNILVRCSSELYESSSVTGWSLLLFLWPSTSLVLFLW
jgi:hypothetical protein